MIETIQLFAPGTRARVVDSETRFHGMVGQVVRRVERQVVLRFAEHRADVRFTQAQLEVVPLTTPVTPNFVGPEAA